MAAWHWHNESPTLMQTKTDRSCLAQPGRHDFRKSEGKTRRYCKDHRSLGNGVRKNGVRNRCPYRRCGVDTEIPYRLPFWREVCWVLQVHVRLPGSILNFRIGFRLVDRGVDCRDPVCRHRFRFLDHKPNPALGGPGEPLRCALHRHANRSTLSALIRSRPQNRRITCHRTGHNVHK